jgi:branched-chain amino acid transport system permease protein
MESALSYVIAGLALGGIYALSATGIVLTFRSAGILNFAFGAMAYFIARFYYYLNTQQHWSSWSALLVAVVIGGPLLGVALWAVLFRFLRQATHLVKVVATIGLAVAIPPLAAMLFGNTQILAAPGLAPIPVGVFHIAGAVMTMDQLIVYGCVLGVLVAGGLVLRFTDIGLKVRAVVDSEALTSLSGTSPASVSVWVWAASSFMAGLAGVLIAPFVGLDPTGYTLLMAAAFAAVVAARLRSLATAATVGVARGVASSLGQGLMPPNTALTSAIIPSIPFTFIVVFLVFHIIRSGRVAETATSGSLLDRSIRVQSSMTALAPTRAAVAGADPLVRLVRGGRLPAGPLLQLRNIGPVVAIAITAVLPIVLSPFWSGLVGESVAFAVAFLGYTLVTGEGGMIWLCQITFAGVGAITTAQLAGNHGWPVLLAIVAGGLIAAAIGTVVGLLTIRLGDIYVALVTLTFGLLMENLVFRIDAFYQAGAGVSVSRPTFATTDLQFTYLAIVVFVAASFFVFNVRRSTTGLALAAVRSTEPGSRTLGISVVQMKLLIAALGAFVSGVGGGLLACYAQAAVTDSFATLAGMVWLAVVVTIGVRSSSAALFSGLAFTFVPAIFLVFLPISWAQLPIAMFGLGAVLVARNPDGALAMYGRQLRSIAGLVRGTRRGG